MARFKEIPKGFTVEDGWEELLVLLQSIDNDLKKTIIKGTKRSGVNARKGLRHAIEIINNIYHASLVEQKIAREGKEVHGNTNGAGIKAMQEALKRKRSK